MMLTISSTRSLIWAVTQGAFGMLWVACSAALIGIFLGTLFGLGENSEGDLGIIFILLVFGLPVTILFARRFIQDSVHHLKRHVTFEDDALLIRDPVWLDGPHRIPFDLIARVIPHEGDMTTLHLAEERILDISFRAPAVHKVHIDFTSPLNFRLRETPLIFDMFFSFLDPGAGEGRRGVLLETRDPDGFIEACAEVGIRTAAPYQPDITQADASSAAPASASAPSDA